MERRYLTLSLGTLPARRGPIGVFVASCGAWLGLCLAASIIVPQLQAAHVPSDPGAPNLPALADDLQLGDRVPGQVLHLLGGRRAFVVYARCPSCSIEESKRTYRLAMHPRLAVLDATEDRTYFDGVRRATGSTSVFRADVDLVRQLNVAFSPRYYEINREGRLTYIQRDPSVDIEKRLRSFDGD